MFTIIKIIIYCTFKEYKISIFNMNICRNQITAIFDVTNSYSCLTSKERESKINKDERRLCLARSAICFLMNFCNELPTISLTFSSCIYSAFSSYFQPTPNSAKDLSGYYRRFFKSRGLKEATPEFGVFRLISLLPDHPLIWFQRRFS